MGPVNSCTNGSSEQLYNGSSGPSVLVLDSIVGSLKTSDINAYVGR